MGFRKYTVNENYFEVIDIEDKAYFLGLLYSDGYNWDGKSKFIALTLSVKDIEVLVRFKECLESNHKIVIRERSKRNANHSDAAHLQINSRKISEDLSRLGCSQGKTKTLLFPKPEILHESLIPHFIRGYFDGDGSVWEGKRKTATVKDNTRIKDSRIRIIHNVKFSITGTNDVITAIQTELVRRLGFGRTKINKSKRINNCVQLEYSGRRQLRKFYDYIYTDAHVYMKRKKEKFETILNFNNKNSSLG